MSKRISQTDKRKGMRSVRERSAASVKSKSPTITINEAKKLFMDIKRAENLKDKTLLGYERNLEYFNDWLQDNYDDISVSDITAPMIREYMTWCVNDKTFYDGHPYKSDYNKERKGLSPASVNVRVRVLKVFFNTLYKEEIIERNPAHNIQLMKTDIDTVQPLANEELRKLLNTPDTKYYAQFRDYVIFLLMLDTGIRLNEVCALEVKDVDLIKRQIVLPAAKNKNRKTRILPLSSETSKLLLQLITENKSYFETDHVFVTNYGEPVNEKTLQKAFTKYAKQAGIEKRVSPHVLRHNFAKMAALNGMDIFTLMRIMGHADISTTRKYVQVNDEEVREKHAQYSPLSKIMKRK
jgi:integrase/recombinase XerD